MCPGQTLNAVVFKSIIEQPRSGRRGLRTARLLLVVLALEAGLLFVAANTGFLGGPAVLVQHGGGLAGCRTSSATYRAGW